MGLADRLAAGTTIAVLCNTVLLGAGAAAWGYSTTGSWPASLVGLLAVLGAASMGLSHLVMRQATLPVLGRLRRLAREIRNVASAEDPRELAPPSDEEVGTLARAVNHLLRTVRAEREELRKQSLERRLVLEMSSHGILVVDADGRIRYANPFFRRISTLRGEPEGRMPIEVIPIAEVQEAADRVAGGEVGVELAAHAGSRDLVVRGVPLEADDVLVMVDDVTEFRDAERSRADFVANVSHELRTPVTAIMGYAETLLLDADRIPDDLLPFVETIDRNARRLRDLFEDLLRLHRIESRKRSLPLSSRPLLPILQGAVGSAMEKAESRNQRFELLCDPSLVGIVNPEALTTLVGNLALNASNYTEEGGHVAVRAVRDAEGVKIEVSDDGIGIPAAHHERVFERFFRVDDARSRGVGGTGLGLAIVKHLALATGCRISLQSTPGKGTLFTVRLPGPSQSAGSSSPA